jgi:CheY-like chemotaxis protein
MALLMRKLKILIIDNDEDEQFFIEKGFSATDLFEIVGMLNNGNDLIQRLQSMSVLPDVIISDLNMPGKSGLEILEELKGDALLSGIPVIITTNVTTQGIEDQCHKLGAFDIQAKPANFLHYEQFAKKVYDEISTTL